MSSYWQGRRVLVTGAAGFIGSYVCELLVRRGANVTAAVSPNHRATVPNLEAIEEQITVARADLTDLQAWVDACRGQEVVINAAHVDGNMAFKRAHPAFTFRQNMLMTLHMLEAAHRSGVDRLLVMSSMDVYSSEASPPFREADGFVGLPTKLLDGYAWSKRMSEFAAEAFAREHDTKVAIARPGNVYGPRDLSVAKGRVIPMFVRQIVQSTDPITIWGTGDQVRTFLYVEDLALGLLDLVEKYPVSDPINFASDETITIKDLAELIAEVAGRRVEVICDPTKPSGPPRAIPDTTKARQILGFTAPTSLRMGLRRTVDSYRLRDGEEQARAALEVGTSPTATE